MVLRPAYLAPVLGAVGLTRTRLRIAQRRQV
jgi:hypothetical protein